ncbi:MAG TPA: SDR family oxidoreductase, partial [Dehalococcoidia bacterium]|nr:SDR family oxidoreductase [Dehalococcoidia bacterium]
GIHLHGVLEDTSSEDWDRVMAVNSKGVFLGTKTAIPEMRKAGGGSIVNISSTSGIVAQTYVQPVYNASEGAVRIFTKSAAIQYAKEGIRVNSVHPGAIDTPMAGERLTNPELQRQADERSPMSRTAHPDEVAYGVLFLASD